MGDERGHNCPNESEQEEILMTMMRVEQSSVGEDEARVGEGGRGWSKQWDGQQ